MPDREDAWAFVWKALRHLSAAGLTAFLLPAMGFLHNIADTSFAARKHLIRTSRILRIINFADLRFQLFDSAIRRPRFSFSRRAGTRIRTIVLSIGHRRRI